MMGDKIASRRTAIAAGVPGVPGTEEPLRSAADVEAFAAEHGFPLAIKASAGGGGRGLKVARDLGEVAAAYESAGREAEAWFGDPAVYIERYLDKARHIEAQIMFDQHGNGAYLGERDCSLQRRHQKLIEETPAVGFTTEQRATHSDHALAVARAAGYQNAGTVEFLMDTDGSLYFLEMNARIQVEHTITEAVTGIDLVTEQLRVAAGEKLSFSVPPQSVGHAIEFRINAEDPARGFLPTPGILAKYREPAGPGVRVDSGVRQGSTISQYYDNMIAKLIVWGRDRDEAIRRGKRALEEFEIGGVPTTIPAHLAIIASDEFRSGDVHTKLVEQDFDFSGVSTPTAPALPEEEEREERTMTVEVGGRRFEVRFWAPVLAAGSGSQRPTPRRRPPKLQRQAGGGSGEGVVLAPMQGTIVKVHKKAGDRVREGEPVCVLEAMKMENEIKAPNDGEIIESRVQPGDTVSSGAVLMVIR
jgi:acetyl-CoA/propionyl-CoA carboxylase biotin carboxyl carrier protein